MSPIVRIPSAESFVPVFGPTPQSISIGRGARKDLSSPGGTIVEPEGRAITLSGFLSHLRGNLGDQLIGSNSDGTGQTQAVANVRLKSAGQSLRLFPKTRDIQEGFINGDLLETGTNVSKSLHDALRHLPISPVPP